MVRTKPGDVVEVESEFMSGDEPDSRVILHRGLRGTVKLCDDDGDAIVTFPGPDGAGSSDRFVMRAQFRNMMVRRASGSFACDGSHSDQGSADNDDEGGESPSSHVPGGGAGDFYTVVYKQPGLLIPWDIGRPQPDLVSLHGARPHIFASPVLDVGAGFCESSAWLSRGCGLDVVACDISAEALEEGQRRFTVADRRQGRVPTTGTLKFVTCDILDEPLCAALQAERPFATVFDSAVFHCMCTDAQQQQYAKAVASLLKPAGHLVMLALSDHNTPHGNTHLRQVSAERLRGLFGPEAGWTAVDISRARYCCMSPALDGERPRGVAFAAWIMVAQRLEE